LGDCLLRSAISQLASRVGEKEDLGKSVSIAVHNLTLPGPGGESREGDAFLPLVLAVPAAAALGVILTLYNWHSHH
jgi:hypothetical protein